MSPDLHATLSTVHCSDVVLTCEFKNMPSPQYTPVISYLAIINKRLMECLTLLVKTRHLHEKVIFIYLFFFYEILAQPLHKTEQAASFDEG